jgi:hypothetical protein
MNVMVAIDDPNLQCEVVKSLSRTGFGVVEVKHPERVANLPDDTLMARNTLGAAVIGHGFGFDGLTFGAFLRDQHPGLGVVYVVNDPWLADRTRALDHRCERTVLRPMPGRHLCMVLLARVLGEVAGVAGGALSPGDVHRRPNL